MMIVTYLITSIELALVTLHVASNNAIGHEAPAASRVMMQRKLSSANLGVN